MNEYVKINLTNLGTYLDGESSSDEMEVLGSFLVSDVRCSIDGFKEWAEEDKYPSIGGNLSYLEKKSDYIVLQYDEFIFPDLINLIFKIPKQSFIDLLNVWGKVCRQRPPHILIIYNGQRFTVERCDTPSPWMDSPADDSTKK